MNCITFAETNSIKWRRSHWIDFKLCAEDRINNKLYFPYKCLPFRIFCIQYQSQSNAFDQKSLDFAHINSSRSTTPQSWVNLIYKPSNNDGINQIV